MGDQLRMAAPMVPSAAGTDPPRYCQNAVNEAFVRSQSPEKNPVNGPQYR